MANFDAPVCRAALAGRRNTRLRRGRSASRRRGLAGSQREEPNATWLGDCASRTPLVASLQAESVLIRDIRAVFSRRATQPASIRSRSARLGALEEVESLAPDLDADP